ncbi:RsmB/NOP family class I SAM-dependent RNA methyltransferase [Aerococcus vaginalis]
MELPKTFKNKYCELLASDYDIFADGLQAGDVVSGFRVNPLKPDWQTFDQRMQERFTASPYAPHSYYGKVNGNSPEHRAGYVYSQEPSASLVGTVADAKPGERVLDLCAAPGGKTAALAFAMQDKGLLVANEIIPKRAKILSENVERLGLTHTIVTNNDPKSLSEAFPAFFDCIVVDAPCSGEGMFRKNPTAVDEWSLENVALCAARQSDILADAIKMLKPGGRLIYSTCTFAPEEDEQQIDQLLDTTGLVLEDIALDDIPHDHGRPEWGTHAELNKTIRLWPHRHHGEGHFMAKLRLPDHGETVSEQPRFQSAALKHQEQALIDDVLDDLHIALPDHSHLHHQKQHVYLIPDTFVDLPKGIRVRRLGLELGELKKNRFEPSFAFAMAIKAIDAVNTVELSFDEWKQYIHGDVIKHPGDKGWRLLTTGGMPVGFAKQTDKLLKNFYPKGLRTLIQ